jgi:phosphoribosylformylglycinamidine cyclo-ligase
MRPLTYKSAGVDIAKGEALVEFIKSRLRGRRDPNVVSGVGGFGAAYRIPGAGPNAPLLVSGTDSVGTKLKIAFRTNRHDTVGIDCVAMNANDVIAQGAKPLFFLDYLGTCKLSLRVGRQLIDGVLEGCRQAGCTLIGGETAELPGLYRPGEYDLVGFCAGAVRKRDLIDGRLIRAGDAVIGIGSSGLHSNGFSLAIRLLIEKKKLKLGREIPELGCRLDEELLRPTRIYAESVLKLIRTVPVLGLAHITGGGLPGNAPRQLPRGLGIRMRGGAWPIHPVFSLIQKLGNVADTEMLRTFNMGIGFVAIVRKPQVAPALKCLLDSGERAHVVGQVVSGKRFALLR